MDEISFLHLMLHPSRTPTGHKSATNKRRVIATSSEVAARVEHLSFGSKSRLGTRGILNGESRPLPTAAAAAADAVTNHDLSDYVDRPRPPRQRETETDGHIGHSHFEL